VADAVRAELPGLAADRAAVPERRVGVDAAGAQRLGTGAAPDRGDRAAAAAAGPPRLAAVTPWLAVAREISHGPDRPQIPQVSLGRGRQLWHHGPSAVRAATRRRRRQPTQSSRLVGSLDRQFGHSGRPAASRVAGSRTAPQRAQSTAAVRAKQVRQIRCPPRSLDRATTRSQRGHDGRMMLLAWAAISSSMNRSTAGAGALVAAPVSRAGLSATAQASRRCPAGRTVARARAASTCCGPSPGSSPVTTCTSSCVGSPSRSGHRSQRGCPCRSRVLTRRRLPHWAQVWGVSRQGEQITQPFRLIR
jgi:hypothetical protein